MTTAAINSGGTTALEGGSLVDSLYNAGKGALVAGASSFAGGYGGESGIASRALGAGGQGLAQGVVYGNKVDWSQVAITTGIGLAMDANTYKEMGGYLNNAANYVSSALTKIQKWASGSASSQGPPTPPNSIVEEPLVHLHKVKIARIVY